MERVCVIHRDVAYLLVVFEGWRIVGLTENGQFRLERNGTE